MAVTGSNNIIVEGKFFGDLKLWSLMKMLGASTKPDFDADLYQLFVSVKTGSAPSYRLEASASADVNIAGAGIDLAVEGAYFTLDYTAGDHATWSVAYSGYLKVMETGLYIYGDIGSSSDGLNLTGTVQLGHAEFTMDFSKAGSDSTVSATMSAGGAVTLQEIIYALGFTSFDIPSDLDPHFQSASFTYNFGDVKSFALSGSLANGDDTVFAAIKESGTWKYFFGIKVAQTINLSNLPLIGKEFSAAQTLSVKNILLEVASTPLTSADATAFNTVIPSGYPNVPTGGLLEDFVLSLMVDIGGKKNTITVGRPRSRQGGVHSADGVTALSAAEDAGNTAADGAKWIAVQKNLGPVTFEKVGVKYKHGILWFLVDAAISAGGLTISMIGLSVGSSLKDFDPRFNIEGLGTNYSGGAVDIGGSFLKIPPVAPVTMEFGGSVTVEAESFDVEALGAYAEMSGQTSMFVFTIVDHDFGGPGCFFITGVTGGFGYNSKLRIPCLEEVSTFPLVEGITNPTVLGGTAGQRPTPLDALSTLTSGSTPWITPETGNLWLSAGINFTTYELVNSSALLIAELGKELQVSLVGLSKAKFPKEGSTRYAYVELELEGSFIPSAGVISLSAVLSQNSYVIDPACRLTGGFSLAYWYGDNPHAGDFVLTLGGYSPYYSRPAWYPEEPRLGFNWPLDSNVSITGQSYFALTPSALMAGGALDVQYSSGNLRAWLTAHADIIIWWNPFHFIMDIGISIGASYKLDLLFTSVTVSAELGADLTLWGPPTGGRVTVHWFVISFTIGFGAHQTSIGATQDWKDFKKVLPAAGSSSKFAIVKGLQSSQPQASKVSLASQASGDDYKLVRAGNLMISVDSPIPASKLYLDKKSNSPSVWKTAGPVNIKPMGLTKMESNKWISLKGDSAGPVDLTSGWTITANKTNNPSSLWGTGSNTKLDNSQHLIEGQLTGFTLAAPSPQLGSSPGTINVKENLSYDPLHATIAVPLAIQTRATGTAPTFSTNTITDIGEIMSTSVKTQRDNIYSALESLNVPCGANQALSSLASNAGSLFTDNPLLASG